MADLILPSSLAVWDPLGGTPEPLMTGHDGICVHTMAGTFAGTDSMFHEDGWTGTESTVGIAGSGYCKQWVPWDRQADANLDGNPRWLSIECADGGETFPPLSTANDESPPLTDAQVEKIIDLCVYWCDVRNHQACPTSWQCHSAGIPARLINSSCERGIGTHYHGVPGRGLVAGCPPWSNSGGKICPRMVRHRQVRDVIVPEVARRLDGESDEMTEEQMSELKEFIKDQMRYTALFLAKGPNTVYNPGLEDYAWADDADVWTLKELKEHLDKVDRHGGALEDVDGDGQLTWATVRQVAELLEKVRDLHSGDAPDPAAH